MALEFFYSIDWIGDFFFIGCQFGYLLLSHGAPLIRLERQFVRVGSLSKGKCTHSHGDEYVSSKYSVGVINQRILCCKKLLEVQLL